MVLNRNFFGDTLREIRKSKNKRQEELAEQIDITQAQWSAYEVGKSQPDLLMILKISKVLEINPLSLIARSIDKSRFADTDLQLTVEDYDYVTKESIEKIRKERLRNKITALQQLE